MKALSFAAVLLACSAMGQVGVAHHDPDLVGEPGPRPTKGVLLEIDIRGLNAALASAPLERLDAEFENYGTPLTLIGPDGQGIEFFAVESPVMEPGLGAKFPEFKTYVLRSLDGGHAGRLEITPRGVTAMLRAVTGGDAEGRGGTWMIDPWQSRDPAHAIVYWMRDLPGSTDWECETIGDAEPLPTESGGYADRFVQNRLTYRIAVACTGEYGAHHSALQGNPPNIADPLAAIVTVVARTNVVYEADLGVHFNLVANNDLLMFTDGTTDPYTSTCGGSGGTDCSGSILGENPGVINGAIGSANYDIGHCVTRIFGGVANLRCVCTNNKARGVSGIPRGGDVDPLSALVVIHEIGHQFGANHTFNGTRGRCAGNVNLPTGWEAGSGSTPMAYAGGCPVGDAPPSDNIVQFAEPYFHHGSYLEMNRFITGNGGSCAVSTPTANDTPEIVLAALTAFIPPATPFVLTASATDPDGDVLAYSWEQFDSGFARPLIGPDAFDNGQGALFRVFPPTIEPRRYFPRMSDILAGTPTAGEMLPTFPGAERTFRAFVRDNNPLAGGVAVGSFATLTVPPGASPFAVTSPAPNARVPGGPATISWSVGGTNLAPISAASVVLELSADNGATWPTTLGTFTNNGTATISLPAGIVSNARVRVLVPGQIFFNISGRFRIGCPADYNDDNAADGDDVIAFFGLWDVSDPGADFNADGGVDGDDIIGFFGVWDGGC